MYMTGLDRVILLVNDMTIKGNTRVQKYGFLASQLFSKELSDLNFYDDWEPYSYGPHSQQLSYDLRECVKQNLIDEQVETTINERRMHIYSLKIRGRAILQKLTARHGETIKTLYDKFSELNRKSMNSILKDIYEAYPAYTVNSEIKDRVLNHDNDDKSNFRPDLENSRFNADIENKLEMIQDGNVKGKKYSVAEYLQHVDQILED